MRGRRSIRLPEYDYRTAGAYFVTICAYQRRSLFVHPPCAEVAEREWTRAITLREGFAPDAFVVMPNHVHGIGWILPHGGDGAWAQRAPLVGTPRLRAQQAAPLRKGKVTPGSLGAFVRGYKSAVTRAINLERRRPGAPVWQRNYYEHVIRSEADLDRVRRYIEDNPGRWEFDRDNPAGRPDRVEQRFWKSRGR